MKCNYYVSRGNIGCSGGVTDVVTESEISEHCSNSKLACCVYFRTNAPWKCMNLLSSTSYGLNKRVDWTL